MNNNFLVHFNLNREISFSSDSKVNIYDIDKSLNLKNYFSRKDVSKLLEFMKNDKKNNSNKINLILIKKIGNVTYNNFFDLDKISKFIRLQFYNM